MPPESRPPHAQTPFATGIHLLITLFVAASYIPQLIDIGANDRTGNAAISGWYIILLTTSATAHLATRIKNLQSSQAWHSVRHGNLKGFDAFSSLVVFLQAFIHWAAAIILLVFYVSFRTRTPSRNNDDESIISSPPSAVTILAVVLVHAVIVLPFAVYFLHLLTKDPEDLPDSVVFVVSSAYGLLLRITGTLTSLTAAVPQVYLMVTRYRNSGNQFNQGSLSLLGLGLQVVAFLALAGSQGWRMRILPPPPDAPSYWQLYTTGEWWYAFFVISGYAVGWATLAFSQLLVLCVALGLGSRAGALYI
ncbi:hypothetical protein FE257_000683 [Aspergillus nanangensis]|uniref:Uncharacterized protein n=1 Tax=Aspergillus nanangensis TaxID=2582783 RepID=A0AAD4CF46_ASPNN|nr:hypothetical protein FE257_000683 [Aspergillus nanangensis]